MNFDATITQLLEGFNMEHTEVVRRIKYVLQRCQIDVEQRPDALYYESASGKGKITVGHNRVTGSSLRALFNSSIFKDFTITATNENNQLGLDIVFTINPAISQMKI
jgi:hypothetical protein